MLNGQFKGVSSSGAVTVWVDALGRVQRFHLAPGASRDSGEGFLVHDLIDANAKALRAAENLEFAGASNGTQSIAQTRPTQPRPDQRKPEPEATHSGPPTPQNPYFRSHRANYQDDDYDDEPPESFLEKIT